MVAANAFGRQVVVPLTNKSGGGVIAGDVVYLSDGTNADSFTTGTTSAYTGGIGIAQGTIANNAVGLVLISGYAALVNVNASVTIKHYGYGHTVAKQATDAGASRIAGTFCQFLTGGTTPDAVIWQPDLGGGSGMTNPMTTTGDTIYASSGSTPARLAAGTSGFVLTAAGAGVAPAWAASPYLGTRTEALLGADVTMTTANTEYDGPTSTPAAGTYDVLAFAMFKSGVTNVITNFVGRLKYGSTVVDERQHTEYVGNDFGYPVIVPLSARVTADGATAIKISGTADRASAVLMRDPFNNSSGVHRATLLVLVRVS